MPGGAAYTEDGRSLTLDNPEYCQADCNMMVQLLGVRGVLTIYT